MNKYHIFTTISEINKDFYLKRLINCLNVIKTNEELWNNSKFYAIVDGRIKIGEEINSTYKFKDSILKNVEFIDNEPILGIKSNTCYFPGWKRSFKVGLQLLKDVDRLMFIDNDVKILKFDKIIECLNIIGENFSAFGNNSNSWPHIETSLMIINNKQSRLNMIKYYENDENIFNKNGLITEDQVDLNLKPHNVFLTQRIENTNYLEEHKKFNFDFIAAYWHKNTEIL